MISNNCKATNLKLELTYSRITIKPSLDDQFYLTAKREKEFFFDEQGSTLILKQKKRHIATYFVPILNWRLPTLAELQIPKSFTGSIMITNKDGWVKLFDLNLTDLQVSTRNGKIILADVTNQSINTQSNNGKVILTNITDKLTNVQSNNGKILLNNIKSEALKLESKNGKIKGTNIDSKAIDANSHNGKIILEDLNSDNVLFNCNNGKIISSFAGEEKQYAFDIKVNNGKSIIAGKKNTGSYIYLDKEKNKQISAIAKNGNVILTFLNK